MNQSVSDMGWGEFELVGVHSDVTQRSVDDLEVAIIGLSQRINMAEFEFLSAVRRATTLIAAPSGLILTVASLWQRRVKRFVRRTRLLISH